MKRWKILLLITCMSLIIIAGVLSFLTILKDDSSIDEISAKSIRERIMNRGLIESLRRNDSIENKTINGSILTKIYNSTDKSIQITDDKSNTLIDLKLTSPYIVEGLVASEDVKVADFQLEDWKDGKKNLIDTINFYDVNDNYKPVDKTFRFKWENITERCVQENASKEICFDESTFIEFETLDELPRKNVNISMWANTKVSEKIEWIFTIEEFEILEWAQWDVSTLAYVQKLGVGAKENAPNSVSWKPDGTKMYIFGSGGDDVTEYNVSIPWNVSSAVYSQDSDSLPNTNPFGLFFKPDGTKVYHTGEATNRYVYEYNLSIAWNVASIDVANGVILDISSKTDFPKSVYINPDGDKLFVGSGIGDLVLEYNLTVPWIITSALFNQQKNVTDKETNPFVSFRPDGTQMYIGGEGSDSIHEYNLTIPWDIGSAVFFQSKSVIATTPRLIGFFIKADGTKLYAADMTDDEVHEYNLSVSPDTTLPNVTINQPLNQTYAIAAVNFNVTALDETGMSDCEYSLNLGVNNFTMANLSSSPTQWTAINTTMADGSHTVNYYCDDTSNNLNNSENVTFFVQKLFGPNVTINQPLNQTYNISTVNFNVTATDVSGMSNCSYTLNNGISNISMTNLTSSPTQWAAINTTMVDGPHTCTFYCVDTSNNVNNTESIDLRIETLSPSITVTTPDVVYFDYGNNYIFNWTFVEANPDACWYTYNSVNTTVTCADNNATLNITNHNLNDIIMWINDSYNSSSSTDSWDYDVFVYSNTYNATTYVTESQTFILNMSSDGTQSVSADLIYGGVNKGTGTKTGNNFNMTISKTIDIPDITSPGGFNWNVTYGSSVINTTNLSQIILPTNLSYCAGDNNVTFINFTFKDEETLTGMNASIDASTWIYALGTSTENSTYYYSNTASVMNWPFCFDPADKSIVVDLEFKYSNTSYPQRTYAVTDLDLTNTTTQQTLYLLGTADGIYSSIMILDYAGHAIGGVAVTAERKISGTWVVIGESISGSDGVVTFWVNPDYSHRFTAVKTGYVTAQVNVQPSQSLYTLTMVSITAEDYVDVLEGITYLYRPSPGHYINATYNINVTVESSTSVLENCKFELLNASDITDVLATGTSLTNSSYCRINHLIALTPGNNILGKLSIDTTNTTGFIVVDSSALWLVLGNETIPTWRHITGFFDDIASLAEFGDDENKAMFSRFILFFLVMSIFIGVFFYFTDINADNTIYGIIIIWVIAVLASVGGFFTINLGGAFEGVDWLEKYVFVVMLGFITTATIIKQIRKEVD